jgi:glutamine amidotransferase-like uncharacterized protein
MRSLPSFLIAAVLFATLDQSAPAFAKESPLALVYKGDGTCLPCVHDAAKVAKMAGFDVRLVTRRRWHDSLLDQAKVWIQPGGQSSQAAKAMGPELMAKVEHFVAKGGGYVGFCAGGFLSTRLIGDTANPGLGIVPGSTAYHVENASKAYRMEKVRTPDGTRWVYFAGGAQFVVSQAELDAVQGRATSWTTDGSQILSLEGRYGAGKVAVSGFHPEASWLWKKGSSLIHNGFFSRDPDGSDRDFAIRMIRYATSP